MNKPTTRYHSRAGVIFVCLLGACSDANNDGGDKGSNDGAKDAATAMHDAATAVKDAATATKDAATATKDAATAMKDAGTAMNGGAGSAGKGEPSAAGGMPVDLGAASAFAVLAKAGISTVPTSAITGDIGVSPAAASYITGFSLDADATNVFATSPQVVGRVLSADYAPPTPSTMTAAIGDMETAFSDAAGRAPDMTGLGGGDIGGMTLEPGTYKWSTGLSIPTDVTLAGDKTGVWIFQVAGDLELSNGKKVVLKGGAQAENIFWQVAGGVTLGTTAHLEGIVLSQTAITLRTGASVNGRLFAQTSVDIDSSTVVEP